MSISGQMGLLRSINRKRTLQGSVETRLSSAVVSSGVQPEQSESPGHQTENVSSAMVETKRFYGGSNAKRPRIAHKLELAITSDGRRCGRQRKAPIRYVETD